MNVLTDEERERFISDGFIRLPCAFPRDLAHDCVEALWPLTGVDRANAATWTSPVVRIAGSAAPPLVAAINSPRLLAALDDLLGHGRWQRRTGYGTFPVRFPSEQDPGDTGWHVDGSYEAGDQPPPWNYYLNFSSRGRALLLLMLFSDVGPDDAPTRIRTGSHLDVARLLVPYGPVGAPFADISNACAQATDHPVVHATGEAGDVYLCHPFLLHAANWPHKGTAPRFLGQPPIHHTPEHDGFEYTRTEPSAAEIAVRRAIRPDRRTSTIIDAESEE